MTARARALGCALAASIAMASAARAGVWGTEPVIGVSADYSTNPALVPSAGTPETHAAFTLDAPSSYVGNAFKLSAVPQFRFSNSRGYSTVDSNYAHLDLRAEFDTERGTWIASVGAAQDSSLARDYLTNGSAGVRRDTGTADINWDHHLTERWEVAVDANGQRTRYGAPVGVQTLTDNRYVSVNPQVSWDRSERSRLTLALGAGRYDALNGTSESRNAYAQAGYVVSLSELWSLTAQAGYTKALNNATVRQLEPVISGNTILLVPVDKSVASSQTGALYKVGLTRSRGRITGSLQASQQLLPTGFAYLTRQYTYELHLNYAETQRLSFDADVQRLSYHFPAITSTAGSTTDIVTASVSASYQLTPAWTATMTGSYVTERYGAPAVAVRSAGASLALERHFHWAQLP
ncbi:MAG: hypothetical protein KGL92_08550 [Gammaproteobacteria bacterium]|nr:hypothetical protein [Gammaproteobacteria bacterium]